MSIEKKLLIIEGIILTIIILVIVAICNTNINLGLFKIVKLTTLTDTKNNLDKVTQNINTVKNSNSSKVISLETAKQEFKDAKLSYDGISEETLNIIKEATLEETYDIEYMWIKLGNYAKVNNLNISLVEPGGNIVETDTEEDKDDQTISSDGATEPQVQTSSNLMINVIGDYLDLAEFVFDVENDVELRFKLDKIKMNYAQNNNVTATFEVKNVVIEK